LGLSFDFSEIKRSKRVPKRDLIINFSSFRLTTFLDPTRKGRKERREVGRRKDGAEKEEKAFCILFLLRPFPSPGLFF